MAWTTPRTWTDGELVTAALMNTHVRDNLLMVGPHLIVRKASDQTVTSSTTLVNDTALVLPVVANEIYQVQLTLLYSGANGSGDIKIAFTFPTSGRVDMYAYGPNIAGDIDTSTIISEGTSPTTAVAMNARGTSVRVAAFINGIFTTAGTGGSLTLQWAQNTSSGTATTVYANSTLWAVKLA